MSQNKHCHPLEYAGSSQIERLVAALQPGYFQLDERSLQDLIVAASQYAQALRFFDHNDQHPEGVYWDRFWEVELLTYLAVVAAKDTDELRKKYEEADLAFTKKTNEKNSAKKGVKSTESPLATYLPLIELLRQLAWSIEDTYQKLSRVGHPLQIRLLNSIRRDNCCDTDELESALRKLIKYHKAATSSKEPLSYTRYEAFFSDDRRWGLRNRTDFEAIVPDTQITQEVLREIFIIYYDAWLLLKKEAKEAFDVELARAELPEDVEERVMEPHVALFIAFLRLFRHAQDSLNELSEKHLDYYYDQALGFCRRPETPDEVWLILKLARDVDHFLLQKGEAFLAGNDKNGAQLIFEAIEDWVLRQATVADIRNTYIDPECGKINANPDVAKAYENGVEKPNESALHWRSMGDDNQLPDGQFGWAIASPQLILREGKRVIDLKMKVVTHPVPDLSWIAQQNLFGVWLSAREDWVRLAHSPDRITDPDTMPDLPQGAFNIFFTDDVLHFRIVLERDDPAIEALGEDAAALAGFNTPWPMLKIIVNPQRVADCPPNSPVPTTVEIYEILRTLCIGEIRIAVKASGIRENLIVQNDQGLFDGAQKVFPFGPTPEVGNKFFLGSTEVFQKALTCLKVCFDWIAPPDDFAEHYKAYSSIKKNNNQVVNAPNPYLKIDFIDRADVPIPKQLTRFGKRGADDQLGGMVTDMNGNPLEAIRVVLLDANNSDKASVATDSEGRYAFSGPIDAQLTIVFRAPPQSDADPDKSPLYESLTHFAAIDGGSPSAISIGEFAVINAVLFPKNVLFGKFDQIRGKVEDIYGNPINSGVTLTLGGDNLSLNADGTFNAPAKNNQNLVVSASAAQFKAPSSGTIQLDDFTQLRIVLEPAERTLDSGIAINASDPRISGKITDSKSAAQEIENAFVEVSNSVQTIKAFSNANGDYELPLFAPGNSVRFFPYPYANAIILLPTAFIAATANKPTINARLLSKPRLYKRFIDETVRIRIVDRQHTPITTGVNIAATPGGAATVNLQSNIFEFSLPSGISENPNVMLTISGSAYEPVSFRRELYGDFTVMLFPKDFAERSGATSGTITGVGFDRNGQPLSGFSVEDDMATAGAVSGSSYSITPNSVATKLIFKKPGFENLEIDILGAAQINPFLKPATTAPLTGSTISGQLLNADGTPAENVSVEASGFLNGKYLKFESKTDATGNYTLQRTNNLTDIRLVFRKDDFVSEAQGFALGALFLSNQVTKIRPPRQTLEVRVLDINDVPVKNAEIRLPDGSSAKTGPGGGHTFAFSSQSSLVGTNNTVEITHPAYKTMQVNVEQGCFYLEIRLLPVSASFVVSGAVTDVAGAPIPDVRVSAGDEAIETRTNSSGGYQIKLPVDMAKQLLLRAPAGFAEKVVSIQAEYPNLGQNFSKSDLNVILNYQSINYVSLLDAHSAIKPCFEININALNLARDVRTQHFERYSQTLKRGFLVFNLEESDFLHKDYPQALSHYAFSNPKNDPPPNPPYAPAVNGISLEYCSEQTITGANNAGIDRLFHILPFNGHKEVSLQMAERLMVYPYNPHDADEQSKARHPYATGNLYIGLDKLTPGSALSLLFRIAAGTERNPELLPPQLLWSWLGPDNRWFPFEPGQVLRDETRGLTRSGIVQIAMPTAAVNRTTMLPGNLFWLRVAAIAETDKDRSAHALPSMQGVDAQVVRARFANKGNELSHLAAPLPAGTVSGLLNSRAEVRGVSQPMPSVGGRLPESMGLAFRTRVSERLRHKDRAVTVSDFERLLLERYPHVAVVRCIPHTRYKTTAQASELAPGCVSVAVVPHPTLRAEPWLMPRFPQADLDDMRDFLASRANLFVAFGEGEDARLQVFNPHYEPLDIQVKVYFLPEYSDTAFYEKKLADELRNYISPWLANPLATPVFRRNIVRSKILQFIEERYYVDYVDMSRDDWGRYSEFLIRRRRVNTAGQILGETDQPLEEKCLAVKPPAIEWVNDKACPATARSIFVAGYIAINTALPSLTKCPQIKMEPSKVDAQETEAQETEDRPIDVVVLPQGSQPRGAAPAPDEKKKRKIRQPKSK